MKSNVRMAAAQPGADSADHKRLVNGVPHDAGHSFLSVTNDAGFVDVLVGEADVGDAGSFFRARRSTLIVGSRLHFTPLLRGVVFVGQAALGAGCSLAEPLRNGGSFLGGPPTRATRECILFPVSAGFHSLSS